VQDIGGVDSYKATGPASTTASLHLSTESAGSCRSNGSTRQEGEVSCGNEVHGAATATGRTAFAIVSARAFVPADAAWTTTTHKAWRRYRRSCQASRGSSVAPQARVGVSRAAVTADAGETPSGGPGSAARVVLRVRREGAGSEVGASTCLPADVTRDVECASNFDVSCRGDD
jgi:hypothetical protein